MMVLLESEEWEFGDFSQELDREELENKEMSWVEAEWFHEELGGVAMEQLCDLMLGVKVVAF